MEDEPHPSPTTFVKLVNALEALEPTAAAEHAPTAQKSTAKNFVGEQAVRIGLDAGLDPDLDLRAACADFYVLEELVSQSTRVEYVVPGTGTLGEHRNMVRVPTEFERDNRLELRQTEAIKRLDSLERRLAREFSTYIGMMIGGELRHGTHQDKDATECGMYDHEHGDSECVCDHECGSEFECCTMEEHEHDLITCWTHTKKCTQFNYTKACSRYDWVCICRRVSSCCLPEHEHDLGQCECGHDCFEDGYPCCQVDEHEHDDDCCSGSSVEIPAVLTDFVYKIQDEARSSAWKEWLAFRQRHPGPEVLEAAAKMFDDDAWSSGFGGGTWAQCARVLAEYEAGRMSRRVFVDRCWTLEHNGGCIFNKLYYWACVASGCRLRDVLEAQAGRVTDDLLQWTSAGVRGLVHETRRMTSRRKGVA